MIEQADALEGGGRAEEQIESDDPGGRGPLPPPAPAKQRVEKPRASSASKEAGAPSRAEAGAQAGAAPARACRQLHRAGAGGAGRVQWPDRNQVTQATGVVVVFCFLAGAYLAFWDFVFSEFVTWLL